MANYSIVDNKNIVDSSNFMELIDELAIRETEVKFKNKAFVKDEEFLSDDAQDYYNGAYDEIEALINKTINVFPDTSADLINFSKQVNIKSEEEPKKTSKCDICEEDINMDEDFYRYGHTHKGEDVLCCESCEHSEMESSASCVPYGDYNYDVGERYSFSPLFGALNPHLEELWGKEEGEFPVKKMEWKNTDGWRGYYDLEFQDGWLTFDGWITGWVDDTIPHKGFVLELLEDLQQETETLDFPLWIITTQTSNVFSTATDIIFREEDKEEFESFLQDRYGKDFNDLKKSLS
jgi:hypothetical protein|tara:strand:- start:86 stop:961 length:876 start_codon:yes stop_codon:yes gene_type:complete